MSRYRKLKLMMLTLLAAFLFGGQTMAACPKDKDTIAVTQIVSHESLDKVREGILDELKSLGLVPGDKIDLLFDNAQGNIPTSVQIAQKFASSCARVLVGIATPSAQALVNAVKQSQSQEEKKAVVFASISDPISAGLVSSLEKPGGFVTGTIHPFPLDAHVKVIGELFPHVKTVGVIANLSEVNTTHMVESLSAALKARQITLEQAAVTQATQVKTAAESLVNKVDLIVFLQDNTVASAVTAAIKVFDQAGKPMLAAFSEAVQKGVPLAISYDEYAIGRQTGVMIQKILKGMDPGSIAVGRPTVLSITLHKNLKKFVKIDNVTQWFKTAFPDATLVEQP